MAQPQVSDMGFGYVNKHESVEMPDTDNNDYPAMKHQPLKSPLKSAMKTPGAPPRDLGNILSPTFKEEDRLEKEEALTEKQQAADLVCTKAVAKPFEVNTDIDAESKSARTDRQVLPPRRQLLLLAYRPVHAVSNLHHLQRHQGSTTSEQSASMGCRSKDLASGPAPLHRLRLTLHVHRHLLLVLERRTQSSRESRCLLLCLRRRLLHLQHSHVGHRSGRLAGCKVELEQQGYVGMGVRGQHPKEPLRERSLVRTHLPSAELESGLRHHRDCR